MALTLPIAVQRARGKQINSLDPYEQDPGASDLGGERKAYSITHFCSVGIFPSEIHFRRVSYNISSAALHGSDLLFDGWPPSWGRVLRVSIDNA